MTKKKNANIYVDFKYRCHFGTRIPETIKMPEWVRLPSPYIVNGNPTCEEIYLALHNLYLRIQNNLPEGQLEKFQKTNSVIMIRWLEKLLWAHRTRFCRNIFNGKVCIKITCPFCHTKEVKHIQCKFGEKCYNKNNGKCTFNHKSPPTLEDEITRVEQEALYHINNSDKVKVSRYMIHKIYPLLEEFKQKTNQTDKEYNSVKEEISRMELSELEEKHKELIMQLEEIKQCAKNKTVWNKIIIQFPFLKINDVLTDDQVEQLQELAQKCNAKKEQGILSKNDVERFERELKFNSIKTSSELQKIILDMYEEDTEEFKASLEVQEFGENNFPEIEANFRHIASMLKKLKKDLEKQKNEADDKLQEHTKDLEQHYKEEKEKKFVVAKLALQNFGMKLP